MKELVAFRPMVLLLAGTIVMGALVLGGPAVHPDATPSMGFWEAAARGFVTVVSVNETFTEEGQPVTLPAGIQVTNTASVPVVIPEEAVLMSPHPSQSPQPSPSDTTAGAALTNGTVPAGGSLLYSSAQFVLAGLLSGPMYWDLEETHTAQAGVAYHVGGETLPFGLRTLVEHPFFKKMGDNTQTALYTVLRSYPEVVVGKQPLWAKTNGSAGQTVRMRLDATNLAVWSTDDAITANVNVTRGIVEETVPAGWSVKEGSFSVPPDVWTNNTDGTQTLQWYENLAAAQVSSQGTFQAPTPFEPVTRFYTLVAPALYGEPVTLPRLLSDMNRTGTADAHSAPVIVAGDLPPLADAGGPYVAKEGQPVLLNASKSSDPENDPLQYRWSFTGNGTWDTAWSASPTATVTYTDEFTGQAVVEVTDGHSFANATAAVTISNVPPTIVSLSATEVSSASFRLTLAGEKWHDATFVLQANGTTLVTLRVTRIPGDPTSQSRSSGMVTANRTKPIAAWVAYTPKDDRVNGQPNGDSPAWLTVTFADGSSQQLFHNFNVRHAATWNWSLGSLSSVFRRGGVSLAAHVLDPGADALTAHWDFGDGTNATQSFPNGPAGDAPESPVGGAPVDLVAAIRHDFAAPGTYTVTLTVTDADGASTSATLVVTLS